MPDSRRFVRELISVDEAREEILRSCGPGATEEIAIDDCVGRVLRRDVVADLNVPPFDNSAMDGFAVSLTDIGHDGAVLKIAEDIPAGSTPSMAVGDGHCARIMTGAPVPKGADAVVPVEWCHNIGPVGGNVIIDRRPEPGQHIRKAGSDISIGEIALRAPHVISPLTIGVLASLGSSVVPVSCRPSVSVVATGDELVDSSSLPQGGEIRNSNGPALAALTRASGAQLAGEYVARDDLPDIRRVLENALVADIVVISGGVSVGSYDFVKRALDDMGMQLRFWRVRQRPGKPLTFGTIGKKLIFGLPGNPVSTAVCYRQYVLPAIRKMLALEPRPQMVRARIDESIEKPAQLHFFIPGIASVDSEGEITVRRSGVFGSHIFSSLAAANCLISIPEDVDSVSPGSLVSIELFSEL